MPSKSMHVHTRVGVDTLLGALDLETKVRLISGAGAWTTQPVDEIGLRSMTVSDGPIGVRGSSDNDWAASAALPSGSAMAATWDEDLLRRVGHALAAEAVRKRVDVVLGPTINLHRSPLGGRHFECFAEDPLLTGRLATAYVHGLQERGIGACPKHYVANDAETDRMTVDNRVDEQTLRELYLAPFEAVVEDAEPWLVMAAYNGVNGAPMTENDLLAEPLKGDWGFDGVVVSDWGATYHGESAARAALDLTMPGPEPQWGDDLVAAVRAGRVAEADIDAKVRRLLVLADRVGALGAAADATAGAPGKASDCATLAREATAASAVLVRNEGILPMAPETLRRVAVVGPGARNARPLGGGSAIVFPPYLVMPYAGLADALDGRVEVVTAAGTELADGLRPVRVDELDHPGADEVATVRWLDADGTVLGEEEVATALLVRAVPEMRPGAVALEWASRFVADADGEWQLGVSGFGAHQLQLDGMPVLHGDWPLPAANPMAVFTAPPRQSVPVRLQRGQSVQVRLRYEWQPDAFVIFAGFAVSAPRPPADEELAQAVELARSSDVAVVVVGTSEEVESEGMDRTSLALPGRQDELVHAVAAANPHTIVVVNAGAPVEMPWRHKVSAILLVWFPGMEFGTALADVLLGVVEPGGRLPTTWPAAATDAPVLCTTPTAGRLDYAERLDIGHRGYLTRGTEPAFWFGHGLGYTTWEYQAIDAPTEMAVAADDRVAELTVTVRVHNTGSRRGKQVVQVYAARPGSAVRRPVRWLAGFTVVHANPGEIVEVPVVVSPRQLRHWDADAHAWAVEPGALELFSGPHAGSPVVSCSVDLCVPALVES